MSEPTYRAVIDDQQHVWRVATLWARAAELPVFDFPLSDFTAWDQDCWFCGVHVPTVARVVDHMRRVQAADLAHPIILSAGGQVMDGVHRLCKARLLELPTVRAVRFTVDPPPDSIQPFTRG
jgi:hypothetical protein